MIGSPVQGQAALSGYRLDQDDVIQIVVSKHPEFSVDDLKIPASGMIRLPVVSDVMAKGRTLAQLDNELTQLFKKRLKNPEINVLLKEARPRLVFVNGTAVAKPGAQALQPGWRVSDAVAAAGGLALRPGLVDGTLERKGQASRALSDELLFGQITDATNVLLESGDTLRFVPRLIAVSVNGAVTRPGNLEVPRGQGVREVIAMAGGYLPDRAAPSRVTIQRGAKTLSVNLFEAEKTPAKNLIVEAGDSIQVPEATETVTVIGAGSKTGTVRIPDGRGLTLTEALAQSGGPQTGAALSKATLKRANGQIVPLDLNRLLVLGQGLADPAVNLPLQPGDTILIPVTQARITVSGAVNKPGFYDIEDGRKLRVDEAIALAGNPTEKAALTRATLKRGNQSLPIDLYALIALGQRGSSNYELQDGDIVTVPEARGVTVLGAVAKPGIVYLEEGTAPRLRDALTRTGSLAPNIKADEVRISVVRKQSGDKQQVFSVDPVGLLSANDPSQNLRLQDGDDINVAEIGKSTVTIQGEILKPGAFELREGDSLSKLIVQAGGQTTYAALRRVEVRRGEQKIIVDALAAVKGGGDANVQDFLLKNDDKVIVPRTTALVAVWPAVKTPGRYPIPEDGKLTVDEALAAAGGALNAKLKEVAILREGPDGKPKQINLSINDVRNGFATANQVLLPGDVLFVPQDKLRNDNSLGLLSVGLGILRVLIP